MIPAIQNSLIFIYNESKIIFLLIQTLRFSGSYFDPEDVSSWFFDDKNGA